MTNFQEYLAKRRINDNASGKFTRDVRDDPRMAHIESWPALQAYILRRANQEAVPEIIRAAEPVWKGYRALVLKARRQTPDR
jgi:hypothetical protein